MAFRVVACFFCLIALAECIRVDRAKAVQELKAWKAAKAAAGAAAPLGDGEVLPAAETLEVPPAANALAVQVGEEAGSEGEGVTPGKAEATTAEVEPDEEPVVKDTESFPALPDTKADAEKAAENEALTLAHKLATAAAKKARKEAKKMEAAAPDATAGAETTADATELERAAAAEAAEAAAAAGTEVTEEAKESKEAKEALQATLSEGIEGNNICSVAPLSQEECKQVAVTLDRKWLYTKELKTFPGGCMLFRNDNMAFNTGVGEAHPEITLICKNQVGANGLKAETATLEGAAQADTRKGAAEVDAVTEAHCTLPQQLPGGLRWTHYKFPPGCQTGCQYGYCDREATVRVGIECIIADAQYPEDEEWECNSPGECLKNGEFAAKMDCHKKKKASEASSVGNTNAENKAAALELKNKDQTELMNKVLRTRKEAELMNKGLKGKEDCKIPDMPDGLVKSNEVTCYHSTDLRFMTLTLNLKPLTVSPGTYCAMKPQCGAPDCGGPWTCTSPGECQKDGSWAKEAECHLKKEESKEETPSEIADKQAEKDYRTASQEARRASQEADEKESVAQKLLQEEEDGSRAREEKEAEQKWKKEEEAIAEAGKKCKKGKVDAESSAGDEGKNGEANEETLPEFKNRMMTEFEELEVQDSDTVQAHNKKLEEFWDCLGSFGLAITGTPDDLLKAKVQERESLAKKAQKRDPRELSERLAKFSLKEFGTRDDKIDALVQAILEDPAGSA